MLKIPKGEFKSDFEFFCGGMTEGGGLSLLLNLAVISPIRKKGIKGQRAHGLKLTL